MHARSLVVSQLLTALLVLVCTAPQSVAADDQPRPNVLFMIADDLNCDLSCYGHPIVKTPNIDALAARGVRFEHAYCQFPLCSPSRSSFLTGRRPNVTKVLTNPGRNPGGQYGGSPHLREAIPDTVTMPQFFRNNGYFVARIGKLYHYGVPGQIGTAGLDDPPSWEITVNPAGRDKAEEHRVTTQTPGQYGATLSWLATDGPDEEHTDGLSATSAISFLEEFAKPQAAGAPAHKPFFLAVGFFRPHTPYVAPRHWFSQYPPELNRLPKLSEADVARTPAAAYRNAKPHEDTMTDEGRRVAMQSYYASISHMDSQVGRVLAALDRLGFAKNTVVVMTSDHGYHMYEHGMWQKMTLFENSARVPLIIAAPGAKGNGHSSAALAELVDLYPTLAACCGLQSPEYLGGASLQPILSDPAATVKDAAFTQIQRGEKAGYSIRTAEYRYTLWNDGADGEQLYDMRTDPGEMTNLAAKPEHAATVARLKEHIRAYAAK
ncbi:MAG: sulfatase [Planctomycetaceae bacterium]